MENEKFMFAGVVLLALLFGAFMVFNGNGTAAPPAPPPGSGGSVAAGGNGQVLAPPPSGSSGSGSTAGSAQTQEVSLIANSNGYDKSEIRVKAGVPVHLKFTAIDAGCGSLLIIDNVGVRLSSNGNTVDATFTPPAPGNYPYHCGMNMYRGVLVAE